MIGYAAIFWAVDQHGVRAAIQISGSSLLTLGFAAPGGFGPDLIAFSEAAVGVGLIALVIAYLPTIYAAYSRRELVVAMLDARAGVPPNATQLVLRHHQYGGLARLDRKWNEWERWVVDIGQTHMTHPFLAFFRSATWEHSLAYLHRNAPRHRQPAPVGDRAPGRRQRRRVDVPGGRNPRRARHRRVPTDRG